MRPKQENKKVCEKFAFLTLMMRTDYENFAQAAEAYDMARGAGLSELQT